MKLVLLLLCEYRDKDGKIQKIYVGDNMGDKVQMYTCGDAEKAKCQLVKGNVAVPSETEEAAAALQ